MQGLGPERKAGAVILLVAVLGIAFFAVNRLAEDRGRMEAERKAEIEQKMTDADALQPTVERAEKTADALRDARKEMEQDTVANRVRLFKHRQVRGNPVGPDELLSRYRALGFTSARIRWQ